MEDFNWRPRIIRSTNQAGEEWYALYMVAHSPTGVPIMCSVHELAPMGENIEDLRKDLCDMLAALNEPALTEQDFVETQPQLKDDYRGDKDDDARGVCGCGCEEPE